MLYEAAVLGVSAGGLRALKILLPALPPSFPLPIIIVQHIGERSGNYLSEFLDHASRIFVKEAEDKEVLSPGTAYLAPPGYHTLVEQNRTISLSVDPRVNFSRSAIDVLFESAAVVYGQSLIDIILTGANRDGAHGLKAINARGGLTIVQSPQSAEAGHMPKAALAATSVDHIVGLEQLVPLLLSITTARAEDRRAEGR